MAFIAKFKKGNPLMANYTPGSAVAAGAVVVIGDLPVIAHSPIAASTLGSVSIRGGIYTMPKATGGALAGRTLVYWDATNSRVTTTAGSNKKFGYTGADGALSADTTVDVEFSPHA